MEDRVLPAERPAPARALVDALSRVLQREGAAPQVIETHISWVVLAGAFAYKIKKPVRLGFLDFQSLESRRHFCAEELRLNQRLAPQLYIDVVKIGGSADAPVLGGGEPVIDYAVRMHRLAPLSLASERLARGALEACDLERLALRLHAFHRAAPAAEPGGIYGTPASIVGAVKQALGALATELKADPASPQLQPLQQWFDDQAVTLAAIWRERLEVGCVREGHGDLHLDNVVVQGSDATAFDCIEFDPALRWIDVMNDIAFLVMDLLAHGRRDLAFRFLNAYLDASGDYAGLAVLPFYMTYRALVRALVATIRQHQGRAAPLALNADAFLQVAQRITAQRDPRLLITFGLPGSGKTTVTAHLVERVGAVRLRSDVERKRLFGLGALGDSSQHPRSAQVYAADATRRTYERLRLGAGQALAAGYPTIVDAAFLLQSQRDPMRAMAEQLHVPFTIVECTAGPDVLRQRVSARQARHDDASEADVQVLEHLTTQVQALNPSERACAITLDMQQPLPVAALAANWLRTFP